MAMALSQQHTRDLWRCTSLSADLIQWFLRLDEIRALGKGPSDSESRSQSNSSLRPPSLRTVHPHNVSTNHCPWIRIDALVKSCCCPSLDSWQGICYMLHVTCHTSCSRSSIESILPKSGIFIPFLKVLGSLARGWSRNGFAATVNLIKIIKLEHTHWTRSSFTCIMMYRWLSTF